MKTATRLWLGLGPEAVITGRCARITREARLQGWWCAERHFPAPIVLAVLPPRRGRRRSCRMTGRLAGTTAAKAMAEGRPDLGERLGLLLADLHSLPVPTWAPPDDPSGSVAERRLSLLPGSGVPDPVVCHPSLYRAGGLRPSRADRLDRLRDGRPACRLVQKRLPVRHHGPVRCHPATKRPWRPRVVRCLPAISSRYPVDPVRLSKWRPLHVLRDWAAVKAEATGLRNALPAATADRLRRLRLDFSAAMA